MGVDQQQQADERRQRTAKAFERALNDPDFREKFLSAASPPEGKGSERHPAQLPPQALEKRREVLTQVLDRAQSDQQFRQQLTTDPRQALRDGGFSAQLEQLRAEMPQAEVSGYSWWWYTWSYSWSVWTW